MPNWFVYLRLLTVNRYNTNGMTITVVLETDDDGRLVVRKAGSDGPLPELLAESQWLDSARRDGVAELISTPSDIEVVTRHGGSTTARTAGLDAQQAAVVLATVADILADLALETMVHGNLDADHILTDGTNAVLISPSGTATDPADDLAGLGSVIGVLRRQWSAAGSDPDQRWAQLEAELTDPLTTLTARRAASLLRALGPQAAPEPEPRRRVPVAAILGAAVLVAAGLGAAAWPGSAQNPGQPVGSEVVAGDYLVRVGDDADLAVGLGNPCPGQPVAAVLRPASQQIWTFDSVTDDAQLRATVAGATELGVESVDGCEVVVISGPAGQTELAP